MTTITFPLSEKKHYNDSRSVLRTPRCLLMNHPLPVDGGRYFPLCRPNDETFLVLNGHELNASVDEQEKIILQLAAGNLVSCRAGPVGSHSFVPANCHEL